MIKMVTLCRKLLLNFFPYVFVSASGSPEMGRIYVPSIIIIIIIIIMIKWALCEGNSSLGYPQPETGMDQR